MADDHGKAYARDGAYLTDGKQLLHVEGRFSTNHQGEESWRLVLEDCLSGELFTMPVPEVLAGWRLVPCAPVVV
jgi:hypothetical protein